MRAITFLICELLFVAGAAAQTLPEGRASLSGAVMDRSNQAMKAKVRVYSVPVRHGYPSISPKCDTTTAQDGRFECTKLAAGHYLVETVPILDRAASASKPSENVETVPQFVFSPNASEGAQASTVTLHADDAAWLSVLIPDENAVAIQGRLRPHAPQSSLRLDAALGNLLVDTRAQLQYDSETGAFTISAVPPGDYILRAEWSDSGTEYQASTTLTVGSSPLENVILSASPLCELRGQIVHARLRANATQVQLQRVDGAAPPISTIANNGTFQFPPIPAGDYVLTLPNMEQAYVDEITVGGKDFSGPRLSINPGVTRMQVDVSLTSPAFALEGTVSDWDTGSEHAEVVAQSEESGEIYEGLTDKQHRFSFRGLPPGTYRLYAWPGENLVAYQIPVVLARYKQDSVEASIEEGSLPNSIVLEPIETLR